MKIDFSDYKSLTENDILNISSSGIDYHGGTIDFEECLTNFIKYHNTSGKYIGAYDLSENNYSLCFYTAPQTTHFFFLNKKEYFIK